jgi:hypothetical protein
MLAVTAGDWTCGENSTQQDTARVSQVVFGVPDTGAGAHHLHVPVIVRRGNRLRDFESSDHPRQKTRSAFSDKA